MKKWRNGICILLSAVLFLSFSADQRKVLASPLSDSIRQKQEAIQQAQVEKTKLQTGLTDVKAIIDDLQNTKNDLSAYVTKLDASLSSVQEKIAELKELISKKEKEIEDTTKMLDEAIATEEKQYEAMKSRIKFMYEKGNEFYLEIMLTSESFGELLNKADYVEQLSAYDRNLLEEYKENKEFIAVCKQDLEAEQEVLNEAKKNVEAEEDSLSSLISSKETEINAYESDIGNKQQTLKEYQAEIAAQDAAIAELEKAVAEEKKRLEAENASVITYDGGMFKWPAPSYTKISDDYGTRIHPILGVEQFHNGVDMAAPGGSPILAAYDGEVVAAAYSGSMGNYVMINHGGGLYTIYMHASALYVSTGTMVTRGDKIAAVGTTGRSTGNHLHFSVRLNGSYVSPWNYLSQ